LKVFNKGDDATTMTKNIPYSDKIDYFIKKMQDIAKKYDYNIDL